MPFNPSALLNNIDPNILFGGGLLGLSTLGRDEPGHVTEARQVLRGPVASRFSNIATDPALLNQFEPFLQQQERDVLDKVQERVIAGRPSSLSTAIGGPEVSALQATSENILAPRRQSLIGDLALKLLGVEQESAKTILGQSQPNALNQALGTLGGIILSGGVNQGTALGGGGLLGGAGGTLEQILTDILGGGGDGGGGGGGSILDVLGRAFGLGGGGDLPDVGPVGIIQNLLQGQGLSTSGVGNLINVAELFTGGDALAAGLGLLEGSPAGLFSTLSPAAAESFTGSVAGALNINPTAIGGFEAIPGSGNVLILGSGAEAPLGVVNSAGQVVQAGTGAATDIVPGFFQQLTNFEGALGAPGIGSLGGIVSGLFSGAAGFGVGNLIGGFLPDTQIGASLGGAGGGALAGFAVGGPVGAAIGGLVGAVGGFFGSRSESHAQKEANRIADGNSQASQVRAIADFFLPRIEAVGGSIGSLAEQSANLIRNVNSPADEQAQIASLLGPQLLSSAKILDPRINTLDDIPGLRDQFVSFLAANAWVEPRAGERSPFSLTGPGGTGNAVRNVASLAGFAQPLAKGGHVMSPTFAIVGEEGPELAVLPAGSTIIPLSKGELLQNAA